MLIKRTATQPLLPLFRLIIHMGGGVKGVGGNQVKKAGVKQADLRGEAH